jgi:hypothetical protein
MCGHRCTVIAVCVLALSWVDAPGPGQTSAAVETTDHKRPLDFDEWVLKRAGHLSDTESLLAFLRERSASDDDLLNVEKLTKQLGDQDPRARKVAAQKLVALHLAALPHLAESRHSSDPEIVRLTENCIDQIEKDPAVYCDRAQPHRLSHVTQSALPVWLVLAVV